MDRLVLVIVRIMVWLSGHAGKIPGIPAHTYQPGQPVRILLVGYNGARNTGADARVDALIGQLRRRFGTTVELSVMTLDQEATKRMFGDARQIQFSEVFFLPLLKACSQADVVLLCEGSTLKSTFANALSLFFCQAAGICRAQGKPCIAYGSEVGSLDPVLQEAVDSYFKDVLFIARSKGSFDRCKELGLCPVLGTDTAWDFQSQEYDEEAVRILMEQGWDGKRALMGIAPINPFCRPAMPFCKVPRNARIAWVITGLKALRLWTTC